MFVLTGCGPTLVTVRAKGRVVLDQGEPVAAGAPLICGFYTRKGGAHEVPYDEKTARVRPDGTFAIEHQLPVDETGGVFAGVHVRGQAIFIVDTDAAAAVKDCPEGDRGHVCELTVEIAESLTPEAAAVAKARSEGETADLSGLCGLREGLNGVGRIPELKEAEQEEKARLSGRIGSKVGAEQAEARRLIEAEREPEAIERLGSLATIPCVDDARRKELQKEVVRAEDSLAVRQARAALGAKAVPEAMEIVDGVLKRSPKHVGAIETRAEALVALERKAEAVQEIEKAVGIEPKNPALRLRLADVLSSMDQMEAAVKQYEAHLDLAPQSVEGYAGLSRSLGKLGRWKEAMYAAGKAFDLGKDRAEYALLAGGFALQAGEPAVAEGRFAAVLDLIPESSEGVVGVATALEREGRAEAALEVYEKAVRAGFLDAAGSLSAGRALRQGGRLQPAVRALERAVELSPGQTEPVWRVEATILLGQALSEQGYLDAAVERVAGAIRRVPTEARLYVVLGELQLKRKRYGDAIAAGLKAYSLDKKEETRLLLLHASVLKASGDLATRGFSAEEISALDRFLSDAVVVDQIARLTGMLVETFRGLTLYRRTALLAIALKKDASRSWIELMPVRPPESLVKKLLRMGPKKFGVWSE